MVRAKDLWKELAPLFGMENQHGLTRVQIIMDCQDAARIKTEGLVLYDGEARREIVQHDPFVTYEAADMAWAEPAGLAEWGDGPERFAKTYMLTETSE